MRIACLPFSYLRESGIEVGATNKHTYSGPNGKGVGEGVATADMPSCRRAKNAIDAAKVV